MKNLLISSAFLLLIYGCSEDDIAIPGDPPLQISGCWSETDESQSNPDYIIRELRLDTDGFFGVTWFPFETYIDYWGAYEYATTDGNLTFTVDNGNYVPEALDLNGIVRTNDNDELIIYDMYLGHPSNATDFNQESRIYIFKKFSDSCVGTNPT